MKSELHAPSRLIAVVAATATLAGGIVLPATALADDSTAGASQSAQSQTSQGGASDADSKASIVSFNNPTLNGVAGDNSLRLPKTVTAQYSDGSSKDVDVTWSGNGYTADADLMNLPAGTYWFQGTVDGSGQKATATLNLSENPAQKIQKKDETDKDKAEKAEADNKVQTQSDEEPSDSEDESNPIVSVLPYESTAAVPVGFTKAQLDGSIRVRYKDGSQGWESVHWDQLTPDQVKKPGNITVQGTVDGTDLKATVTVQVVKISQILGTSITAAVGTSVTLPTTLGVCYEWHTDFYSVTWNDDRIVDGKIAFDKAGDYTVHGRFDDSTQDVDLTVHVVEIKSVKPLTATMKKGSDSVSLPSNAEVVMQDGSVATYPVDFPGVYDKLTSDPKYQTPGTYEFTGTIPDLNNREVTLKVTVVSFVKADPVEVTTLVGIRPSLPYSVTTHWSDGSTDQNMSVYWDDIDESNLKKPGSFTVNGKLSETSDKVTVTVKVKEAKTYQDVHSEVVAGDNFYMPQYTSATAEDGSVINDLYVDWDADDLSKIDTNKEGSYTVNGHLGQDPSVKIKGIVQVWGIRSVSSYTVHTAPGVGPDLRYSVDVQASNGKSYGHNVNWENVPESAYANPGKFTVKGTVKGTDIFAVTTVYVSRIIKLSDISVSALVGQKSSPSSTVYATYADGGTDEVHVTWPDLDDSLFDKKGDYDIEGTVQGTDLKAQCRIKVMGLKSNEITRTVLKGNHNWLNETAFVLDDGTTAYLNVDWDSFDSSLLDKVGTFDVKGVVSDTKIDVVLHVNVVTVESVKPFDTVTTVTGVMPSLPSYASVVFSDGSTNLYFDVNWTYPSKDQFEKAGEFDVEGTISTIGKETKIHVKVVDSQKTRTVSVSTLKGLAPTLPYSMDTVLMDGTTKSVSAQWHTPDPADYAKTGSFVVEGNLAGSQIAIKCKVNVYDAAAQGAETSLTTIKGIAPSLPSSLTVTLTNGETVNIYNGLLWNDIDPSQYSKKQQFDVLGEIQGTDVKPVAHVAVSELYAVDKTYYNSLSQYYVRGLSDMPNLPSSMSGVTTDGDRVYSLPVSWDNYDHAQLKKLGDITVNGSCCGQKVVYTIHVVDVKKVDGFNGLKTIVGTQPDSGYEYGVTVHYSNGDSEKTSIAWDISDAKLYATAGVKTLKGTASVGNSWPNEYPVEGTMTVYGDYDSVKSADAWTVPGVKPNLPSSVRVKYPTSLLSKAAGLLRSAAAGWDYGDDGYDDSVSVTWDSIDPKLFASNKDNTVFTVKGHLPNSKKEVSATVHVASIARIELSDVTTMPGNYPHLPEPVYVTTKDGERRQVYVNWDSVKASSYQYAGSVFRVSGKLNDGLGVVSVTVRVMNAKGVDTAVQGTVVTKTGVAPNLMSAFPVKLEDGSVVSVPVAWQPVPPANYAKAGSFTVKGKLNGSYDTTSAQSRAMLKAMRAAGTNVSDNGTVTTTVVVKDNVSDNDVALVYWYSYDTVPGRSVDLPKQVGVNSASDASHYQRDVDWDTSNVDYGKPGTYRVTGRVKGTDLPAYCYINVREASSSKFTKFDTVETSVPAGSTQADLANALPDKVVANYSDGTTQMMQVNWNVLAASKDDLNTVGKVLTIPGTTSLGDVTAKVTVVSNTVAVPKSVDPVAVETDEGVEPKLPDTVKVHMSDGAVQDSAVKWDAFGSDKWADGVGDTTFEVNGSTVLGSLDVTATVTVHKVPKFTVTFDANGGKLSGNKTQTVRKNASASKPSDPTKDDYTFVGWSTDKDGKNTYRFDTPVTGDLTLYAQWTKVSHPVETVAITGNGVKDGKISVKKGENATVSAVITPSNATDKTVSWKSSDPSVAAIVDNGDGTATITAKRGGEATITVTTTPLSAVKGDTAKTATIKVNVPASIVSIKASVADGKNVYTKGDAFDASTLTVTAQKDYGKDSTLKASDYTVDPADGAVLGTVGVQQVKIALKSDPTIATTVAITVKQRYWKVSFDAQGGSDVASQSVADDGSHAAKPTDPTRTGGYEFAGWTTDKSGTQPYGFDQPVTGDLKLYAQWKDIAEPTFAGIENVTIYKGSAFNAKDGVTASDNQDGDVTNRITVAGEVDSTQLGEYTLTYQVADASGNIATATRKVTVVAKPIALNSASIASDAVKNGKATLKKGETLNLAAAIAPADATNTKIAWNSSDSKVATVAANADGSAVVTALRGGKTTITLTVSQKYVDPITGKTHEATKTAEVEVTVPRTATAAKALAEVTVFAKHEPKLPKQATVVFDDGSEDSADITWDSYDWASAQAGSTVTLTGEASIEGFKVPVSVNVTVMADTVAPVVTLPAGNYGKDGITYVKIGTDFDAMAGVSASDNADGDVTGSVTVGGDAVDTAVAGTYEVTYTATDENGNASAPVKRTVVVCDFHSVSFNANGGSSSAQTVEVPAGLTVGKPSDPVRAGFTFAGWTSDKAGTQPYDFSAAVNADLELYAQWKTVASGGNGADGSAGTGVAGGADGAGSAGSAAGSANVEAIRKTAATGSVIALPVAAMVALAMAGLAVMEAKRSRGRHIM